MTMRKRTRDMVGSGRKLDPEVGSEPENVSLEVQVIVPNEAEDVAEDSVDGDVAECCLSVAFVFGFLSIE